MSSATPPPSVTRPRLAQLRELLDCSAARAVQLLELAVWDVDVAAQLHESLGDFDPDVPLNSTTKTTIVMVARLKSRPR